MWREMHGQGIMCLLMVAYNQTLVLNYGIDVSHLLSLALRPRHTAHIIGAISLYVVCADVITELTKPEDFTVGKELFISFTVVTQCIG